MYLIYEKILTIHKLPDMFSEYLTLGQDGGLVIYGCKLGQDPAFVMTMRDIIAFHVYEEFCHPNMDRPEECNRPYSNKSKTTIYPVLEVLDSKWINSFSEDRLRNHQREGAKHFQFISYSDVIDVITSETPLVKTIPYSEYVALKDSINENYI